MSRKNLTVKIIEARKMQKRWAGENVDLNKLSLEAETFFQERDFNIKKFETEGEHTILWFPQGVRDTSKAMKVRIIGKPDDFTIEFITDEATRHSIWLGFLTQFLGGGYLVLQGSRLREALDKIENEFWNYMEQKVANLAGSSK